MNNQTFFKSILLLTFIGGLTACPPKNRPRQVHEGARTWTPLETPTDENVSAASFATVNTQKLYKLLSSSDGAAQVNSILKPLSTYVLNAQFVENPMFRTTRMSQMINIFNRAFLNAMDRHDSSAEFLKIKEAYYQTLFAGCSADLRRDCVNVDLFKNDAHFSRILTRFAQDLDNGIDAEIKIAGTPAKCVETSAKCRELLEERYRRLAMANVKRNVNSDAEFSFAYLKYARAFALLIAHDRNAGIQGGYITDVHGKIFEAIIMHYEPKNLNDPEFRAFVENFNPWVYSQKRADTFEHGTKKMFEFGSQCCLYRDNSKTQLSNSVKLAIAESQKESDALGKSFYEMVTEIDKNFGDKFFENLGMGSDIGSLKDINSSFYNEYFLVVDRLFRGHLNSSEVEMVLKNTPTGRTESMLPKTIATYVKVYLINMVIETNKYMSGIYTSNISSDKIFEEAATRSRELSSRWHNIQSQADLLERLMGSYFKGKNTSSTSADDTSRMIKSINRNIHYLSVYPNMIVMTYFLSKMKGNIIVHTWWGEIKINADTILDAFFDGVISSPWFRFGKDPEALDRQMLLYSFEYMISTGALSTFKEERHKFFDLIFTKYLDDNIFDLRKVISEMERNSFGSVAYSTLEAVCDYEVGNKRFPPGIKINLYDMTRYTYSGLGDNGVNTVLNKLLTEPGDAIAAIRGKIESRITYIRAMIDIIERNGGKESDTASGYAVIKQLESYRLQITRSFTANHKKQFECALRLQEIERRRANRLYEEERAHLGKIFDLMKPLVNIKDKAELEARVNDINQNYFRKSENGYRFDEVNGLTYRMSKFDLLMRMKKRIEADIFVTPTATEAQVYGNTADYYWRPRPVKVDLPEALSRDDMVARQTANTLFVNGDSEEDRKTFIDQGMAALNAKSGSYVEWSGQQASDRSLFKYVTALEEFYMQGPIADTDGKVMEVTAEDVLSAYIRTMASYGMDDFDVKNAIQFGSDGRLDASFYKGRLFEGNGSPLPFFYHLMIESSERAGVLLDNPNLTESAAPEALAVAQNEINLRADALSPDYRSGAFVFKPSQGIALSVKKHYGTRANKAFQRITDLYNEMVKIDNADLSRLAPRLALPVYLQQKMPVTWFSRFSQTVDEQKRKDQLILLNDFIRRTGNFYDTQEIVKTK